MTTSDNKCEILPYCTFFNEITAESIANRFRKRYCHSSKEACARYMIVSAKSLKDVPDNLFPNEYDKALEILSNK